jgi:hypothetical protein
MNPNWFGLTSIYEIRNYISSVSLVDSYGVVETLKNNNIDLTWLMMMDIGKNAGFKEARSVTEGRWQKKLTRSNKRQHKD